MNIAEHRVRSFGRGHEAAPLRGLAFRVSLGFVSLVPVEGLLFVRVYGLEIGSVARVYAFLLALAWTAKTIWEDYARCPEAFHWLAYAFVLWSLLSFFWSKNPPLTLARFRTYIQLLAMIWILWDLYQTPSQVRAALQAYVLGSYFSIAYLLGDYVIHNSSYTSLTYRYTAGQFNQNELALLLALGIVAAWTSANDPEIEGGRRFLALVNSLYPPIASFAIMLTGSRGGVAAAVPALLFILWDGLRSRRARAVVWVVMTLALILVFYHLVPTGLLERLATLPAEILGGELSLRRSIWRHALFIAGQHPFAGIGSGAFREGVWPLLGRTKSAHNTFLSVLTETGIIGFALFVAALSRVAVALLRRRKAGFEVWLVLLLVWAIGAFNLTWEYRKATWLVMLLALTSSQATDEESGVPPFEGGSSSSRP